MAGTRGSFFYSLSILSLLSLIGKPLLAEQRLRTIDDSEFVALRGHVRPAVASRSAQDQGELPSWRPLQRLYLHFSMTAAQRADLTRLLKAQQDRRSPQYRHFLTPEQYAARFGLAEADVQKVRQWLESNGFSVQETARSRTWVSFSGNAGQVAEAFHTPLHHYSINGESSIANTAEPRVPKALAGIVQTVLGLHDFAPRRRLKQPLAHYTRSDTFVFVVPDDWETIYNVKPLYGAGLDGSGVNIAVVGQTNIRLTDIHAFRAAAGLSQNDPTIVVPPTNQMPGFLSGDEMESDLDLEWAGAVASNAHILFVTADSDQGRGVHDSIVYAIDNNIAPVISTSYGRCEADLSTADYQALNSLYQQASAQGITIVAASGDMGAADCDVDKGETTATRGLAVDFPASSPYVTGVGGTTLFDPFNPFKKDSWSSTNNSRGGSALGYEPESVWGDGFQGAGGGGASVLETKPAWQTGPGVPADGARDVPDVAFAANPNLYGLLICSRGSCVNGFADAQQQLTIVGGTSAGPPPFAGVLALLIQKEGGSRLGNINPTLYSLAQFSTNVFHDIIDGGNAMPCAAGSKDCTGFSLGFQAGPGYDQTTGLGSLDANILFEKWDGDFQLAADQSSLTIAPGSSANATVTVTPVRNFSGDVAFSCSVAGELVDVTCSLPNTPVAAPGAVTVTITAAITAGSPLWRQIRRINHRSPRLYCSLALAIIPLTLILFIRPRRLPAFAGHITAFVSLCAALMALPSCGGGGGGSGGSSGGSTGSVLLTISCTLPAQAMQGTAYLGNCSASGGSGGQLFSISDGSLPAGVTLNPANGVISGVPSAGGTSSFTITVRDNANHSASFREDSLTVTGLPIQLYCPAYAAYLAGHYGEQCVATGGTSPYTFSVFDGTLPNGLTLDPTSGLISGVPTLTGSSFFTVRVTDSGSPSQTVSQTVTLYVLNPLPQTVYCDSTGASVGSVFYGSCFLNGGNPPQTVTVVGGSVPPGLTLDSTTHSISGTPTVEGLFTFKVQITDSSVPPVTVFSDVNFRVLPRAQESGLVTISAVSGGIVNTTTINVTVPQRSLP